MSDTTTPNYGFDLPAVGASQDTWGGKLNANWTLADSAIHGLASGYLPLTGGTLSGPLQVNGNLGVSGIVGVAGNLSAGGVTAGASGLTVNGNAGITGTLTTSAGMSCGGGLSIGGAGVADFDIYRTAPNRYLQWMSGWSIAFDEGTGNQTWNAPGAQNMLLDGSGNLSVRGNITVGGTGFKPGGGAWATTSDDRVKRNVRPYNAGLADVCELAPIRYEFNGDGGTTDDGVTYYGLSAQATQPIMPELVHAMPVSKHTLPDQLATDLGPLLLALVNAVRELAERITALEMQGA